jgi:PAS domain S-box-containing protein
MKKGVIQAAELDKLKDQDFKFRDFIDVEFITSLCEQFSAITGFVTALLELDGTVLIATGWQDVCTKFHRQNPMSLTRCTESDIYIGNQLTEGKPYSLYTCKNGLTDAAIPVKVSGKHMANFFTGQFFLEGQVPDEDYFKKQAKEIGISDVQGYLAAYRKVPCFSHERVEKTLSFLVSIVEMIARETLSKRALHESEKMSRTWLENSPVCTKIVDLDFNLQYMSSAGVKNLHIDDISTSYGKPYPFDFYPKSFRDTMSGNMRRAVETGEVVTQEAPVVDKGGNELWFNSTIVPVKNDESQIDYLMITSLDTTERKKAEREIRTINESLEQHVFDRTVKLTKVNAELQDEIAERKKMEEALIQSEKLKSLGTITAGISHEFNNILNIISGNVQLLQMDYKDHRKLMDSLSVIKKSIDNGASITDRMCEFTHSEADTMDFVSADINKLLTQSVEFLMPRWRNMAQACGINYNMDMEGMKKVPSILCNPLEIRDVFVNIINNALDSMPDGGRISFRTWSRDNTVFVSITDIGKGMSGDVKKNVFDPFFTTKRPEGTGLGMSTSYSKVVRHSGKIEVDSEEGKGSTFTLQFPTTIETVSPITTPKPETKVKKLSILVVDDEEEICNMLDEFLSRSGHKVKAVYSGAGAVELAKRERFDLVLSDLAMPDVFGYDVIKFLNKLDKRPKIGIITGWDGKFKPMNDKEFKVDFIIRKPFELSVLTKHMNDVFGVDS